jgi:Flp pilus assembly pilin Flp
MNTVTHAARWIAIRVHRNDRGASLVEYGLLVCAILVAAVIKVPR